MSHLPPPELGKRRKKTNNRTGNIAQAYASRSGTSTCETAVAAGLLIELSPRHLWLSP